jgi:hypothetical protein
MMTRWTNLVIMVPQTGQDGRFRVTSLAITRPGVESLHRRLESEGAPP